MAGATVGPHVSECGPTFVQDRSGSRLVILIHGYNNPQQTAAGSFGAFETQLWQLLPESLSGLTVWEYHWPGDHKSKLLSLATYPVKVPIAQLAGVRLAHGWLARRQPDQRVIIVAHSLGCRVALEAMRWIRTDEDYGAQEEPPRSYRGATVEAVFLMAAAVPVHLCERDSDYLDAPWRECAEHVLHSTKDGVLRKYFNVGEWVAGERGPAVGLHGAPLGRWSSQLRSTKLDHSDYWDSEKVATKICELAGLLKELHVDSQSPAQSEPDERTLARQDLRETHLANRARGGA